MKAFKDTLKEIRRQGRLRDTPAGAVSVPAPPPEPDFKQLFSDVKPLKCQPRHIPQHKKPSPHPRHRHGQHALSHQAEMDMLRHMTGLFDPQDSLVQYARPGMPCQTLKRLRNGHWPVACQLDLHGMDRYQAQDALALFLHRARHRGPCLRIIHGKGFGSNGQPVLKKLVRTWLSHHPEVLAFCQANENMGGEGALLVLIRRGHQPESGSE
ncbi:Smr/MutS family protein [Aquitalea sp. LB_tupeE]|uniref:Smr/MutS family protein n=1 Tax=Aquitalea sp. LB_tupeE TaxID=2748078 RepID=UPI0015BDAB29|nr:Smr/MutS family protein [Aquitalea sp. LB_tupeE]NWK79267.1 Smr/MutS family protein [Aquitalea sp. LB_tupeE]